ncbi:MAG: bifunctional oligoribonuclease/PAP phosphatase NrnA [Spirochaetia bacterium]|nr:bifunctional oligoribonuclease/PAP phosphatase NrnA [Spirochaetia bacterium]
MKDIADQIKKNKNFYIFGHMDPDGDCIGSQLGLGLFLKRIGKNVRLFSQGKFDRVEIKRFEPLFHSEFVPFDVPKNDATAIIVDCSTPDRTGIFADSITGYKTIIIDHHSSGTDFGDLRYVDPDASSNTMLILQLIDELGEKPTKEEAELLMLGLCTDTGFFRHLTSGGYRAFETAARLTQAGASPNKIYFDINGNRTLDSRYQMAKSLGRVTPYFDGKLLITYETMEDYIAVSPQARDIDTIYMLLLGTENVKAVANIKEDNGSVTVGLRTREEDIDLGKLAGEFNGGGHKKAAGFKADGTIEEIRNQLVEKFHAIFK